MAHDDDQKGISPEPGPLRVLLIEDNPDDAELCRRILSKHRSGVHLDVVSTFQEFADRLHSSIYALILSDYNLGKWTAADALNLVHDEKRDIPFILVTGTLGEEKAVECIKDGMSDFILKDRLERLPVSISRALKREKAARRKSPGRNHLTRE